MDNLKKDIKDMSNICKELDETGRFMILSTVCLLSKQKLDAQTKEQVEKEAG